MFPARLKQNPRILILTLIITFISGANFFSVLLFWPTQAYNVYGQDPVGVGIRGLPIGFSILAGAFIVLWLLTISRGHNRELMIASSVLMTAGEHILIEWLWRKYSRYSARDRRSCLRSSRQPPHALGPSGPGRSWNWWHRRSSFHHHDDYLPDVSNSRCCAVACNALSLLGTFSKLLESVICRA